MSSDPHDKVQDHRAELAHDAIYLSTRDIVRGTLAFEETHDYYRKLSPAARHPFGLPTQDVTSSPRVLGMTPNAPAALPLSRAAGAEGLAA